MCGVMCTTPFSTFVHIHTHTRLDCSYKHPVDTAVLVCTQLSSLLTNAFIWQAHIFIPTDQTTPYGSCVLFATRHQDGLIPCTVKTGWPIVCIQLHLTTTCMGCLKSLQAVYPHLVHHNWANRLANEAINRWCCVPNVNLTAKRMYGEEQQEKKEKTGANKRNSIATMYHVAYRNANRQAVRQADRKEDIYQYGVAQRKNPLVWSSTLLCRIKWTESQKITWLITGQFPTLCKSWTLADKIWECVSMHQPVAHFLFTKRSSRIPFGCHLVFPANVHWLATRLCASSIILHANVNKIALFMVCCIIASRCCSACLWWCDSTYER